MQSSDFQAEGNDVEKAFETAKTFVLACVDYIEENAVWLGIVGVAVLILLVLFGFLGTARRSRKQIKMLRKIDQKMEAFVEDAGKKEASQTALAEDVAAIRAATGRTADNTEDKEAAYERTVESFFQDAEIEQCITETEEAEIEEETEAETAAVVEEAETAAAENAAATENTVAAEPVINAECPAAAGAVSAEALREEIKELTRKVDALTRQAEPESAEAAETAPETAPEETASADTKEEAGEEAPAAEVSPEEPAPLTDLQAALLAGREEPQLGLSDSLKTKDAAPATDGPVAKGRSGRLYTREELENQIRK